MGKLTGDATVMFLESRSARLCYKKREPEITSKKLKMTHKNGGLKVASGHQWHAEEPFNMCVQLFPLALLTVRGSRGD